MYSRWVDRVGQRYARLALRGGNAARAAHAYRRLGFRAEDGRDRQLAPAVVREAAATAVSRRWRRAVWATMAVSAAAGPAGAVVGLPGLVAVLYAWSADLAYVYGLDPHDPRRVERIRALVAEGLATALTIRPWRGLAQSGRWAIRSLGYDLRLLGVVAWCEWAGTALAVMGAGPERVIADRTMARVRAALRREAESLAGG